MSPSLRSSALPTATNSAIAFASLYCYALSRARSRTRRVPKGYPASRSGRTPPRPAPDHTGGDPEGGHPAATQKPIVVHDWVDDVEDERCQRQPRREQGEHAG